MEEPRTYAVIADHREALWAGSDPLDGVLVAQQALTEGKHRSLLLFDDLTGRYTDIDGANAPDEVLARLVPPAEPVEEKKAGPGRPKLGVVAREVSLLPRHWDWLNAQSGGASAALRRLVEDARKLHADRDRTRQATDAAYKLMSLTAMDRPGFEEASRALFGGEAGRVGEIARENGWPASLVAHLGKLLARVTLEA